MRGLFLFLFLFLFLSPLLLWGVGGSRLGLDPSSFKFEYLASSFDQIEFNLGYYEIEFPEAMGTSEENSCSNFVARTTTGSFCAPCDYSSELMCNASLLDLHPDGIPWCDCSIKRGCEIETIDFGETKSGLVLPRRRKEYRFQHGGRPISLELRVYRGLYPRIAISSSPDLTNPLVMTVANAVSIRLCPRERKYVDALARSDTFFVFVLGLESAVDYSLKLSKAGSFDTPIPAPFTVDRDGVASFMNGLDVENSALHLTSDTTQSFFIPFEIDECRLLSVQMENLESGGIVFAMLTAETELWTNDYITEYFKASPIRATSGEVFSVCPQSDTEKTYFVVGFQDVKTPFDFFLFVRDVSDSPWRKQFSLSELSPVEITSLLQDIVILSTGCTETPVCSDSVSPIIDFSTSSHRFLFDPPSESERDGIQTFSKNFSFIFNQTANWRCVAFLGEVSSSSCKLIAVTPSQTIFNPTFPLIPRFLVDLELFAENDNYLPPFSQGEAKSNSLNINIVAFLENRREIPFFDLETLVNMDVSFAPASRIHTMKKTISKKEKEQRKERGEEGDVKLAYLPPQSIQPLEGLVVRGAGECSERGFARVYAESQRMMQPIYQFADEFSSVFSEQTEQEVANKTATKGYYFQVSALTFSRSYRSCINLAISLYELRQKNETLTNTDYCPAFDAEDPCCNPALEWETCCQKDGRNVTVITEVVESIVTDRVEGACIQAPCVESFLEIAEVEWYQVTALALCEIFDGTATISVEYVACADQWLGENGKGKTCVTTRECEDWLPGTRCQKTCVDPTADECVPVGYCVGGRKRMELNFIFCLVRSFPSWILTGISALLVDKITLSDYSENDPFFVALTYAIYESVSSVLPVSPQGPFACNTDFYRGQRKSTDFCSSCFEFGCPSWEACTSPLSCTDDVTYCSPNFFSLPGECSFDLMCNYDNSITESVDCFNLEEDPAYFEGELVQYKCMFCFDALNRSCVAFDNLTKEECESGDYIACLYPDSNTTLAKREDGCPRGDITKGRCEDREKIEQTVQDYLNSFYFSENQTATGACVFPWAPFNSPRCPFSTGEPTLDFSSRRGCVRFSKCLIAIDFYGGSFSFGCEYIFSTKEECEEGGGEWMTFPIEDPSQCDFLFEPGDSQEHKEEEEGTEGGIGHEIEGFDVGTWVWLDSDTKEDYNGFCTSGRDYYVDVIPRITTRENCANCQGWSSRPLGQWFNLSSHLVETGELAWVRVKMVPINPREYAHTIDFLKLEELIWSSQSVVDATISSNLFNCYQRAYLSALSVTSCYCGQSEDDEEEDLPDSKIEDNFIDICNAQDRSTGLIVPIRVYFCAGLNYETELGGTSRYRLVTFGETSTLPVCQSIEVQIAPAVAFVGNHTRQPLTLFEDPNTRDQYPVRNDNKQYPDELEVRPISDSEGLEITEETAEVQIEFVWGCQSEDGNVSLYPILRRDNWENVSKSDPLSEGEEIMFWIFFSLYVLACSYIVLCIILLGAIGSSSSNLMILIFGFMTCLFRSLYICLYTVGVLEDGSSIWSLILVEPPCFFYISMASVLVMTFTFTYKGFLNDSQSYANDEAKHLWNLWIAFQVGLYVILVVVLVLMVELPGDDELVVTCFDTIVNVVEDNTIEIIRIAYHSFALVAGLIVCAMMGNLLRKIYRRFEAKKLVWFCLILNIGVLSSNILWVVYSSISRASPYFIIPLFITEVPVICSIAHFLCPKNIRRLLHMQFSLISNRTQQFTSSISRSSTTSSNS